MLPLSLVGRWFARVSDFRDADVRLIYQRCVLSCFEVPRIAQLLGRRPRATRDAVHGQMLRSEVMSVALSGVPHARLDAAIADRDLRCERFRLADARLGWDWKAVCFALFAFLFAAGVIFGFLGFVFAVLALSVSVGMSVVRGWSAGLYVLECLRVGWLGARWGVSRVVLGVESVVWGEAAERGIEPTVWRATRELLGDDPDSLLVSKSYDGLRSPRSDVYRVDNTAMRTLSRKLGQIDSGTIAVCGPRGAGKSTLLETAVARAGFGLLSHAPASYTPHEFLLSLSVDLCEAYMKHHGYAVPALVQVSPLRRLLRRARVRGVRLMWWSAFGVPAAAAVVLGVGAAVRRSIDSHAPLFEAGRRTIEERLAEIAGIWQGHAATSTGVTIAVLGVMWWRARHSGWIKDALRDAWHMLASVSGIVLIGAAVVGVVRDVWIAQHLTDAILATIRPLVVAGGLWMLLSSVSLAVSDVQVGSVTLRLRAMLVFLAGLVGWAGLVYGLRSPQIQTALGAPDNPVRLAALIAGVVLFRVRHWAPKPAEPPLVSRCRSHLFRLQAQLSASTALTTGTSQLLSLGTSHTTSVATLPPNLPEVVQDFKELLTRIAIEFKDRNETVVIAIDELDRLGTDTRVLAFLAEIKAVFGVEHVHYVLAVAEDVGAAFVRRGLPHRDVTDSSLDDVVHVQPATLDESRAMLEKRAELTGPYATLTHALAGGIPRDLIRYGRRVMDMKDKIGSGELVRIARQLVFEELSETLAGFRILLAKQQWTQSTGNVLSSFRTLVALLRDPSPCPCTERELRRTLQEFAFHPRGDLPVGSPDREVTEEAGQLIDEASAYAYFALTLLDIFTREGLERRTRQAADRGPDGNPERLAEARQELGVSPHSGRTLIDAIRKAWSLPLSPADNPLPFPWDDYCTIHNS
ncbi:P-loop NTPase fold protein [Streptomyces wedmorensis]